MELMVEIRQANRQRNPYKATKKEFIYWFNKLNHEIFDGKLKHFRKVSFKECRTMWAVAIPGSTWSKRKKGGLNYHTDLVLRKSYPSKEVFIRVVAHEMVHHYQWTFEQVMTHGITFWEWKDILEKYGIKLTETIGSVSQSGENGRKTLGTFV